MRVGTVDSFNFSEFFHFRDVLSEVVKMHPGLLLPVVGHSAMSVPEHRRPLQDPSDAPMKRRAECVEFSRKGTSTQGARRGDGSAMLAPPTIDTVEPCRH